MRKSLVLESALAAIVAGFVLGGSPALAGPGCHGGDGAHAADFKAAKDAAFAEADANGDGKLTPDEFANFRTIMRDKVEALRFTKMDTNGDGVISKDELDAAHPHHGARGNQPTS